MAQLISDAPYISPRDSRTKLLSFWPQTLRRLADNQKGILAGEYRFLILMDLKRPPVLQEPFNMADVFKDVDETRIRARRLAQPHAPHWA